MIVGVALFLLKTRFGKAIRAVSDNPDLASSSGIDTDRVILLVWILGGALAGLGGVFYGLEFSIKWDMGFTLLLLMFAAITLGGLGNPFGALLGSLVIGIFVELWTWIVPNANDLKTVGALAVLILVLLIRPQGLLGTQGEDRMNWDLIFWNSLYTAISAAAAGYCIIASGLNVHVGYTGLLNFGQAGFAAIGAYAFSIPIVAYGWPWYWALPLMLVCSVLLALALGLPTLRLRADYLAIVTIAVAEIIRFFLNSTRFTWLTGGTDGRNGWTHVLRRPQSDRQHRPLRHGRASRSTATGCS